MIFRALFVAYAAIVVGAPSTNGGQLSPVTTKMVTVNTSGRSFPARLSYPTLGGRYPAVAFAHGYMNRSSWYVGTLRSIAASGYAVIAPDSETGRFPSHARLADDLNGSLRWLGTQSASGTTAVPRDKVDSTRSAVAGHSMGGGVALLAGTRSRSVDTVVTLAAAETTPRASVAVRRFARAVALRGGLGRPDRSSRGDRRHVPPCAVTDAPCHDHGRLALRLHGDRPDRVRRRVDLLRTATPAHAGASTALARPASPENEGGAGHRSARCSLRQRIKRPYKCQVLRTRRPTGLDGETLSHLGVHVKRARHELLAICENRLS